MFPVADVIPSRTTPWMTVALIAANVLAFLYALSLPAADAYVWTQRFAFVPVEASWTTATTSLFLHENSVHLALNIIVLWIFGDNVEDQLGHGRFLALYLLSGYAAWAASLWATPASSVPLAGAGGAIAGAHGRVLRDVPAVARARARARAVDSRRHRASRRTPRRGMVRASDARRLGRLDVPLRGLGRRSGRTSAAPWQECWPFDCQTTGTAACRVVGSLAGFAGSFEVRSLVRRKWTSDFSLRTF